MRINRKRVLVCNCEGTMSLDGADLAKACEADSPPEVQSQLCRAQFENFQTALKEDGALVVACTQEAPLFAETAVMEAPDKELAFTNIRERAGWAEDAKAAGPKIAALLAEATLDIAPAPSIDMKSAGVCLVYGASDQAIEVARQLATRLEVTILLSDSTDVIPPPVMDVAIFQGEITAAKGHLGAFEIAVDGYAPLVVSSRSALTFEAARNGAMSQCDLILDLTGRAPLFPAPEKRDGYFNPDPGNPAAVQRALFDLVDLVGEFEKPIYVDYRADICAHARSQITGCTRCLDVCPASAIQSADDGVEFDAYLCGGCGGCNSVCPTGAASYVMPRNADLYARLRTLLATYYRAGGEDAVLLVHDDSHGEELMSMMARFGRGLPGNVLPFALNEVTQIGFDFLALALAQGAARIVLLAPPKRGEELAGLAAAIGLAETVMNGLGHGGGRVEVLVENDPQVLEAHLHEARPVKPAGRADFLALGDRREVTRLSLAALHGAALTPVEQLPLAPGAPFGQIVVDAENCTLCLACVGACPAGALLDNPDMPELRFLESNCIQCGICRATCPEHVISLEPRYNFADAAADPRRIKTEEPFECVRCGKPFGTKSSIERIVEQLANKHSMFQDEAVIERIKMCEDCRVIDQLEARDDPMRGADRPVTRTTEDYLREPEIEEARRQVLEDRERDDDEDG